MKMPKSLPTLYLINVNEFILEELELTSSDVVMAPSLKCFQGYYVAKEDQRPQKIKERAIKQQTKAFDDIATTTLRTLILEEQSALALFKICDNQMPNVLM